MKTVNLFILLIIIVSLTSCANTSPKTLMYLDAIEQILFEDGAYLEEVDYISIFINEDNVADDRLAYLTNIRIDNDLTQITGKKHYTRKNHPSLEVVFTF